MFRLPVTGILVEFGVFTGADDLLLLESAGHEMETSIALADRMAYRLDGKDLRAASWPSTDLDALLLRQRLEVFGDEVLSHGICPAAECRTKTDISFRISEYLAHHRPHMPRNAQAIPEEPGWFALRRSDVKFRLVTVADLVATMGHLNPEQELIRRTICPDDASRHDVAR